MKRNKKRLSLNVETIRPLVGGDLTAAVGGGTITTAMTCTESGGACQPSLHCHTKHHCVPVTTYMTCP